MHRVLSVLLQFAMGHPLDNRPEGYLEKMTACLQDGVNSIVRLDTEKLFFMLVPPFIRKWIPLRYWPEFCRRQQFMYDEILNMLEEHSNEWSPGDEINSVVAAWEQDKHKGLMTESDVIHSMQALMMGKLLKYKGL